ncbi:putative acyl-activating enzyme 6 [Iris pallida]|uniref:4-coumarate--CoA ligase n=1 Tax=Iris pallida TaxID=29817 RepID=A0AAX6GJ74_IRIPA|nr:putative acyl-activating enzyme 6 [Iris pallida]
MEKLGPNYANSSPLTPLGFLERTATVYGNLPSVVYNSTVYTWAQTHDRCLRLASALTTVGISTGDIVSVLAPNTPAMYEMHFGVPMAGAVLNTINLRLDARTVSVLLGHSGSKLLFVDPLSWPLAQDALRLLPANQTRPSLVLIDDPYEPQIPTPPPPPPPSLLTYERLIETGDPNFEWIRPTSDWSPMVLNYTSGTTSSPKGVVHCHRGLFLITLDSIIDWSLPKNPIYLWTLPMFHANGWSFPWGVAAQGGTNVCLRRFDAASIYSAIHARSVTHLCGAPVVLNMLANAPDSDRKPLPSSQGSDTHRGRPSARARAAPGGGARVRD